jgi:hypothetical protein
MGQTIIQGEAKTLTFTDSNETDLSSAELSLTILNSDITKDDDDFDDSNESSGVASVNLSAEDTESLGVGDHTIILTIIFSATNIDKSSHTLTIARG